MLEAGYEGSIFSGRMALIRFAVEAKCTGYQWRDSMWSVKGNDRLTSD